MTALAHFTQSHFTRITTRIALETALVYHPATGDWCGDRDQGDVWQIKKPHKNDLHPTMKPVELMERAIRNSSRPGDVVLDPFGGSGSTLIAAEKSGRRARLIELGPKYVDVIVRRRQDFSSGQATHQSDGMVFDKVLAGNN